MTRDEINSVREIDKAIEHEEKCVGLIKDWLKRITNDVDRVNVDNGFKGSGIEALMIKKVMCENRLRELKSMRAELRSKLAWQIGMGVNDATRRAVMVERYCFGKSKVEIGKKLYMSVSSVKRHINRGLRDLGIEPPMNHT